MEFQYFNPVKLFHGENKLAEVVAEVKSFGDKVLLITGGESFKKNGYYAQLETVLTKEGIMVYEMGGNRIPSLDKVRKGIDLVRKEKISSVIGIGGGTCIDIAKTVAFGVKQTGDIWEYLTYSKVPDSKGHLPVGTIITFPSSGSDLNGSTQITNEETGEQAGLSEVYPNFSWQNPRYMMSISNEALIEAQVTAFVQLSLGYIGLGRSEIAESLSLTFIQQLFQNLDRSLADSKDIEARGNLMALSALTVNGLTSLGKQGDWCLYPINAVVQNYCNVGYKQSITVIFPYWLKLIYSGQPEIKAYFHQVLGVDVRNRNDDEILYDGLQSLFSLYRKYALPTSFLEIHDVKEDEDALREKLSTLAGMHSIYTVLKEERLISMIVEAIHGVKEKCVIKRNPNRLS